MYILCLENKRKLYTGLGLVRYRRYCTTLSFAGKKKRKKKKKWIKKKMKIKNKNGKEELNLKEKKTVKE